MIFIREANFDDIEAEWRLVKKIPTDENGYINPWYLVNRKDFVGALYGMLEASKGIGLPEGYVPETTLFIWKDFEIIGQAKVRHYLTEALKTGSGHIGYWIAPEFRGKGFGTEALRLVLEYAERIVPEDEFYLRADRSNGASVRIMEKNGGKVIGEKDGKVFVRIKKPDWSALENTVRSVGFYDTDEASDQEFMDAITKHYGRMLEENGAGEAGSAGEKLYALRNSGEENTVRVLRNPVLGNVGFIWYKFVSEEDRKFAYTVYLYINEEKRSCGYGTSALKELEHIAEEKGFGELRLCVWESNSGAERLYRRLGYEVYAAEGKKRFMRKIIQSEK